MNSKPRVLVIDDDQEFAELVGELLDGEFEPQVQTVPLRGLMAAHDEQPDVIVVDLMMPGLGGWGVLELLRADSRTSEIPIVVVTALTGADVRARALKEGCGFVRKPFDCDELLHEIRSVVG